MTKKRAMSSMGYAIVLVIILGIVMIISAPMMINNMKKDKNSLQDDSDFGRERYNRENIENPRDYRSSEDVSMQMRMMEERMNARLDSLESRQTQRPVSAQSSSDKYVCEIEGNVDSDGNVMPIDNMSMDEVKKKKIVFVCEYRN